MQASPLSRCASRQKCSPESFGYAIDIARRQRTRALFQPHRFTRTLLSDCIGDHQRRGRCEHEPVMARRPRGLEQVKRAAHIHINKGLRRIADDVGLMQRPAMDHRLDAMLAKHAIDYAAIRDAPDHIGIRARRHVEPDHGVPRVAQHRRKETAEPAGRACQKDSHPAYVQRLIRKSTRPYDDSSYFDSIAAVPRLADIERKYRGAASKAQCNSAEKPTLRTLEAGPSARPSCIPDQAAACTGDASRSAGSCASAQSVRRGIHGFTNISGSLRNSSSE